MKRKIYNIKNVGLIGLMGLVSLTQTGCSDFLEIKPQSEIILEDFWNEKADVDNIVTGCYTALLGDGVRRRMMIWGEGRSDNFQSGQNITSDASLYNILKENITAMNSYTTWDGFYDIINRCNTVLKYAPGVAEVDPGYTQGDLKATIAEASAIRDLCYFYLIRTFRDVPYSEEAFTDDDQVMNLPATPFYTVLDYLIADLEKVKGDAVTRFPENQPRYQTGRITRDVIHAMLCEMYLWKKDYDNCIKYADLVIESKKAIEEENRNKNGRLAGLGGSSQAQITARLNGFPLVNDRLTGTTFGDVYEDIFINGASKETIFELSYEDSPQSSNRTNNSAISTLYGNSTTRKGLLAPSSVLLDDIAKTSGRTIFEDQTKFLDSRLYTNCSTDESVITKYATSRLTINTTSLSATKAASASYSWFTEKDNGSKWIIYRLSDIMLLKAEALCQQMESGSSDAIIEANKPKLEAAFNLVNAINKRALCKATLTDADTLHAGDYTTKNLMEELVIRERQRELMFEGKRWFDLVRYCMRENNTTRIMTAAGNRDDVNKQFVQSFFRKMDAIFWPYNLEEMKVNLNLVPNPAFSSGESSSMEKTTD